MKYTSTRDNTVEINSSEAILQGISKDGGLFVPKHLPQIEDLELLIGKNYGEIAYLVMSEFLTDFSEELLKDSIRKAYDEKFDREDMVALEKVGDAYFLELYHGPTSAFKDMALSILPYLLKESIGINGIEEEIIILTATSGDTGKAALEGFSDVPGIKIVVFYPKDGVSEVQKMQMTTQEGENTFVVAIDGNFDDAQNGVKEIFNDVKFKEELKDRGYVFSSANSINIGRLIPQIVYYFYSYIDLLKTGEIKAGEKINLAVPTGNFGNILAGFYAKNMGLPVDKLICASNENNVLRDFLKEKRYDIKRDLILTSSPSMDILVSSNLERLLSFLSHGDDKLVKEKMNSLNNDKVYNVDLDLDEFYGEYSNEDEIEETIKDLYEKYNYLVDPHTAVAYNVYEKYKTISGDGNKTIIASTASPFKFGKKVAQSIGIEVEGKDEFEILEAIQEKTGIEIPKNIDELKDKEIIHKNTSQKDQMKEIVNIFLNEGETHV